MKRYHSLLVVLFITVLLALLVCGCAAIDIWAKREEDADTQQIGATDMESVQVEMAEPELPITLPTNAVPYTCSLRASVPIYKSSGYDSDYVQDVGLDGVYTIVEEVWDAEGNLWGKLKSGVGWVALGNTGSLRTCEQPITAYFADDALLSSGNYREYIADHSEYMVRIAFRAGEPLHNVTFSSLQYVADTYETAETLCAFDALTPETPFVAGVVYYGDMTTYGISFSDSSDTIHCYAVYISGKDGSLVLEEYHP